jgi:hypothetical protein
MVVTALEASTLTILTSVHAQNVDDMGNRATLLEPKQRIAAISQGIVASNCSMIIPSPKSGHR